MHAGLVAHLDLGPERFVKGGGDAFDDQVLGVPAGVRVEIAEVKVLATIAGRPAGHGVPDALIDGTGKDPPVIEAKAAHRGQDVHQAGVGADDPGEAGIEIGHLRSRTGQP